MKLGIRTVLIVLAGTAAALSATSLIPFSELPVSHFWRVILARVFTTLLSFAAMRTWFPESIKRVRIRVNPKRALVGLAVIAYLSLPSILHSRVYLFSAAHIVEGLVCALFIGIDEEFFSRGFIFAALERHGLIIAAVFSSLHFGFFHLGNTIWGGQSISYTLAQVLSASAFGFLCVGLMIYTGSIWFSVVLHGLSDTAMQFESVAQYTKVVAGHEDWKGTIGYTVIYVVIGWVLIQGDKTQKHPRVLEWAKKLSLVETEGTNPVQDQ